MADSSQPELGAPNAGVIADKQEGNGVEAKAPGLWHMPSTSTKTLSGSTLRRRSSSDAHVDKLSGINFLVMSLAEQIPGSTSSLWDLAVDKAAAPPSLCTTPSPGAQSPNRNNSIISSSSSPGGTKVRRPETESHFPRGTSSFSPAQVLQDDEDLDNILVGSRIKPPDPTPAGEREVETDGMSTQEVRRTSSAPLGRLKRQGPA